MALGRRKRQFEQPIWVATQSLPVADSHPFYRKLNEILAEADFDAWVEAKAAQHYDEAHGRPSLPPGVYVRLLFLGYFEDIKSERGMAWRSKDSLAIREYLGYAVHESTPDHSTISGTRRRLPAEFHAEVHSFVLALISKAGLVDGNSLGIDASTLEANAAMRSIVRRDTGQTWTEFMTSLAKASGIETPTRADLLKIDRNREKGLFNKEWVAPNDPSARAAKMKDGSFHYAFKVEHAVDLVAGAIIAAEIHPADQGDTTTGPKTLAKANEELAGLIDREAPAPVTKAEVAADKGYHSGPLLVKSQAIGYVTYVSEPARGRREWTKDGKKTAIKAREQAAVYANRHRLGTEHGRQLLRRRGELNERSFAHTLDQGGMRRTTLLGRENVQKRYDGTTAAFNLSLLMRKVLGAGKPRWAAAQGLLSKRAQTSEGRSVFKAAEGSGTAKENGRKQGVFVSELPIFARRLLSVALRALVHPFMQREHIRRWIPFFHRLYGVKTRLDCFLSHPVTRQRGGVLGS